MSLILKVTPEEVRSKASEINAQKDAMSTYLQDMQGKVNTLQEAWNSPSGQKYVEKFNDNDVVGVVAGASAPKYLIDKIVSLIF